ncbi:hypothetical protein C8R43DRAFT_154748 [Mycena crocata]|nr:hypothetical protein C8R43DRAFT_154748 [Mycena crocata]
MHPALRLNVLAKLPTNLKRLATSAVEGSVQDLKTLIETTPLIRREPLLAVYHACLDPSGIPTPTTLDASLVANTPHSSSIERAFLTLVFFHSVPTTPPGAYAEIWERAWPWVEFLFTYRTVLRLPELSSERRVCFGLTSFLGHIRLHWNLQALIASTPGVRVIVAAAWVLFLDHHDSQGLDNLAHIIHTEKATDFFQEYVDGAGGPSELALTVVRFTEYALGKQSITDHELAMLGVATKFLYETTLPDGGALQAEYERHLLAHGLSAALTAAICALNASNHPIRLEILYNLIEALSRALTSSPGYPWVVEALESGLLRAIVTSALKGGNKGGNDDINIQDQLHYFLNALLPASLVYRSVVVAMHQAVGDVKEFIENQEFRRSPLFASWRALMILARQRTRLLNVRHHLKACDHVECGVIRERTEFQRCAGCSQFYYCSKECQVQDWNAGHRETCSHLRSSRGTHGLGVRDLGFLRAVIEFDYRETRHDMLVRKLLFMKEKPNKPFYTAFDYTRGRGSFSIQEIPTEALPGAPADMVYWRDSASRVTRSGGRLELHWVHLGDGSNNRTMAFRSRSASSEIHDRLVELAATDLEEGKEGEAVRDLLGVEVLSTY